MSDHAFNVLFLCTGNSARSLFAESILNRLGRGRFHADSAGSHPTGEINPYAIAELVRNNHETGTLRSKDWAEFGEPDAPKMDFVFTVCDRAAAEACPVWPGQPMTAHWGVEDPVEETGNDIARKTAFRELQNRISIFVNLPLDSLDRLKLQKQLDRIGRSRIADSEESTA